MQFSAIFATALLALGSVAEARLSNKATLRRQQASAACDAARAAIVGALSSMGADIADIANFEVQEEAEDGLNQANTGVSIIAEAIIAGEAPPEDARDEVEEGLTVVGEALAAGDQEDMAVLDALEDLQEALSAGADVLAEC